MFRAMAVMGHISNLRALSKQSDLVLLWVLPQTVRSPFLGISSVQRYAACGC